MVEMKDVKLNEHVKYEERQVRVNERWWRELNRICRKRPFLSSALAKHMR
jgi:hypothetical protein